MLILSRRLSSADIEYWQQLEYQDQLNAKVFDIQFKHFQALNHIKRFSEIMPCYASISWGKDSSVIAHLIAANNLSIPLVWVKVEPIFNPDCELVRDAFIAQYPNINYIEHSIQCPIIDGKVHAKKTLETGFKYIEKITKTNHRITGIRGQESGTRKMRQKIHGVASANTLAPITYWKTLEVFAYLQYFNVPTHPAYAMTKGGLFDRNHLRVSSIGGKRGSNFDRSQWEKMYYPEVFNLND